MVAALTNFILDNGIGVRLIIILDKPIVTAKALTNIPVIRNRCGGLINPSRPSVECHHRSKGPATSVKPDPNARSLNVPIKDEEKVDGESRNHNRNARPIMIPIDNPNSRLQCIIVIVKYNSAVVSYTAVQRRFTLHFDKHAFYITADKNLELKTKLNYLGRNFYVQLKPQKDKADLQIIIFVHSKWQ